MDEDEFVAQVNVPEKLAEAAWKVAEGDEQQAEELLVPSTLYIKSKFKDSGGRFSGAFFIRWDFEFDEASECLAIVTGGEEGVDVSLDISPNQFGDRLSMQLQTGQRMGGNTDTLQAALEENLQNSGSALRQHIDAGEIADLDKVLAELIQNNLEINKPNVNVKAEVARKIEEMDDEVEAAEAEAAEPEEEEQYVLPCEVEINPIRGVPLARIQIGDMIYVGLGEVEGQEEKIARVLQKRRDDTGLIPAKLVASNSTEAGTMELRVQFGQNVYGRARSGKDVSILVPQETEEKRSFQREGFDPVEFVSKYWVILVALLVALIILFVAQSLAF
ncbi:MAG: hypothetical protein ACQEP7_00985 [bacterium]